MAGCQFENDFLFIFQVVVILQNLKVFYFEKLIRITLQHAQEVPVWSKLLSVNHFGFCQELFPFWITFIATASSTETSSLSRMAVH